MNLCFLSFTSFPFRVSMRCSHVPRYHAASKVLRISTVSTYCAHNSRFREFVFATLDVTSAPRHVAERMLSLYVPRHGQQFWTIALHAFSTWTFRSSGLSMANPMIGPLLTMPRSQGSSLDTYFDVCTPMDTMNGKRPAA